MFFIMFSQPPIPVEWDTKQLYYFNLIGKTDLANRKPKLFKALTASFMLLFFDLLCG